MISLQQLRPAFSALALASALCAAGPTFATEGGSQYPDGAEGLMTGAVPPPGLYLINYLTHYTAGQVNDKDGKKVPVDFNLNATAEVARLLYVSKFQILGGNWGAHIFLPLVRLDYKLGGFSSTRVGVGDITIDPFILSWHFKNFHLATGIDINVPSGNYDRNRPINIGANYWGIEPLVAGTYITDGGFEVSAKLMYTFNTENQDTNYTSGQAFHTDFAVAQHFGDWSVGLSGYWFQQTTDDTARVALVDGNRARAFAIGPTAKYDFAGKSLNATWQHEFVAENRPQGDKFWLKFIMGF